MKIILVISDSKGKNIVFITDDGSSHSLSEAIKLTRAEKIHGVHIVKTGRGSYLRGNPNETEMDNLDELSMSANHVHLSIRDFACIASLSRKKRKVCLHHLELHGSMIEGRGNDVIYVEGHPLITREKVTATLQPYTKIILAAAKEFSIDPNILGAILIDEVARAAPWEKILDKLVIVGRNSSAGIAQVTMDTAKDVIKSGYYNPNHSDKKLTPEIIHKTSRRHIYDYVIQPHHNIRFASARIRQTIDYWEHAVNISQKPDILGTLYSQGLGDPKAHPTPSDRGLQIAEEFYSFFQEILK
ncbi:MAG: DUF3892 domain-containing protein [Candidatus Peribacteraceae bacterium]|jgi:hypothetical protein|nr:DUF3892 domain-containing protein [Candidatus Peribacteraceae bacterium]